MTFPLVSATWLAERLDDPEIAIADCRFNLMQPAAGRQQYDTAHIPGAYYLDLNQDLSSPVQAHGGRHPLPDLPTFTATVQAMGIHSEPRPTLVVVYDDSRMAFAARLWWLLRYLGHDQVVILDGGWSAWTTAGYPTQTEPPRPRSGSFIARPQPERIVDMAQVSDRKDLPTVALVDSREGDRYWGDREPIDPVAGHIPGALNYPWQDVTTDQGVARSPTEQRQRWATLPTTDEVIVYCGSGVTACVNLLALELAGIATGKLYPGSWSDWCSYPDNPVATRD